MITQATLQQSVHSILGFTLSFFVNIIILTSQDSDIFICKMVSATQEFLSISNLPSHCQIISKMFGFPECFYGCKAFTEEITQRCLIELLIYSAQAYPEPTFKLYSMCKAGDDPAQKSQMTCGVLQREYSRYSEKTEGSSLLQLEQLRYCVLDNIPLGSVRYMHALSKSAQRRAVSS